MTFGLSAATIGLIGAGATVASGVLGANAASKAASTQADSARDATNLQREQYNQTRQDNEPFRQGGLKAQNKLLYMLGLDPGGGQTVETRDQIRARLAPQYANKGTAGTAGTPGTAGGRYFLENEGAGNNQGEYAGTKPVAGDVGSPGFTADGGLEAAVDAELARQQGIADSASQRASTDPAYGSLMRDFSMADFQEDPGYKWRLDQGQNAIARGAAAGGRLGSGRYLKDLTRFGQGEASQEYGRAFDRFQINRSNKLNPLQSLLGVGQSATGRIGDAGQAYATNAGNTMMAGANARASGYVGGANAINGAIGQGWNMYQNNRLMDMYGNRGGGGYGNEDWRTTGNGMPPI